MSMGFNLEQILEKERVWIATSRASRGESAPHDDLVGLALSGGGARSATFALGVLRGLARAGVFDRIDYVSGVGEGCYVTGWLTTWIRRASIEQVEEGLRGTPGAESPQIQRLRQSVSGASVSGVATDLPAGMTNARFTA